MHLPYLTCSLLEKHDSLPQGNPDASLFSLRQKHAPCNAFAVLHAHAFPASFSDTEFQLSEPFDAACTSNML
jgi:hypothetical protein